MIIWNGFGIIVPVLLILGMFIVGFLVTIVFGAGYLEDRTWPLALGLLLGGYGCRLFARWRDSANSDFVDPQTGQQIRIRNGDSFFLIPTRFWFPISGVLCAFLLWVGTLIGADLNAPGRRELKAVDDKIDRFDGSTCSGNSTPSQTAACSFARAMKTTAELIFSGGSKVNFMTKGNFLTYCHATNNHVLILCHVPDLKHYKGETLAGLSDLAWVTAQAAAKEGKFPAAHKLTVGLRGISRYGPILEGTVGGPEKPRQNDGATQRLYALFAANEPSTAP